MLNKSLTFWLRRYRLYILTILCTAMFACNFSPASSRKTTPQQALRAESFVDGLGVAVHLSYRKTPYFRQYEEIIKPRLQELGVRHIRDGVRPDDAIVHQRLLDLAKLGIKSTLVIDPRDKYTPAIAQNTIKSLIQAVEAIEGPNELGGYYSFEYIRDFQARLYAAMKAEPITARIPVLNPALSSPTKNAHKLGRVDCDMGNIHYYPGYPSGRWATPAHRIDRKLMEARIACGDKPVVITESGYDNAINQEGRKAVTEAVAAKYLLRLALESFNRGVKRVFNYEFIDDQPNPARDEHEVNFGLLRNDGSPKPAFIAFQNLISLLKNSETATSQSFSPGSLDYGLSEDTSNVHQILFQKNDGVFYLILWQEVPSFDHATMSEIIVPDRPVTLTLKTPIQQANTYQPVESAAAIDHYNNPKRLRLQIPDHPLILELI